MQRGDRRKGKEERYVRNGVKSRCCKRPLRALGVLGVGWNRWNSRKSAEGVLSPRDCPHFSSRYLLTYRL